MAKAINHALQWGKRDRSHGTLFSRQQWNTTNAHLLLWSGASPESRRKWCEELNLYMCLGALSSLFGWQRLHSDGDDASRTPFGSILEAQGVKDELRPHVFRGPSHLGAGTDSGRLPLVKSSADLAIGLRCDWVGRVSEPQDLGIALLHASYRGFE